MTFKGICGLLYYLSFICQPLYSSFISAECCTLVHGSIKLATQLPDAPMVLAGFDFIEMTFFRVFDF